ncbi:MAG TPA: 1,2-phenylacetyl-CoA epoxidase subunit PaaD [Casimicrobiaceae bacterium]|nr:1,2-phenylacetyl-CoA epoxidase subunit PaaD [Casimicrobiaceae bacterium]
MPEASHQAANDDVAAAIWTALGAIVDPEIPVVSIVELGIVRDVACSDDACVVTLTPTYSGCPATRVIEADVRTAVMRVTDRPVRVVTEIAPAWSTEWIAPEARPKLAAFGIAPPRPLTRIASPVALREAIRCPHCGSLATEEIARFGSTACKAQYRCRDCREPFDYFKPH